MSSERSSKSASSTVVGKKSKKIAASSNSKPNGVSLQDKLKMVEMDEQSLLKHIDDLNRWTDAIDCMNDEQLKEYLENRPQELKTVKIHNPKPKQNQKPKPKVKKPVKHKPTCSGIMASVWKFHKEDDDDDGGVGDHYKVNKGISPTQPSNQVK